MDLIFDNIIFSLQKAGGISVVWTELLKRVLKDPSLNACFIEEPNHNIFRKSLEISENLILKNPPSLFPLTLRRYLNPQINKEGIFHSSYYRTVTNHNVINITTVHDFTYEYFRSGIPKLIHSNQKGNAIQNSKKIIDRKSVV